VIGSLEDGGGVCGLSLEDRVSALERKVAVLERDLREHWHDITTIHLKERNVEKTAQVLLPQFTEETKS
jgi:hypothetical protein